MLKIGDKVKIKKSHTRPDNSIGSDPYQDKLGEIISIENGSYLGKPVKKYLVKGDQLNGAVLTETKIIKSIDNEEIAVPITTKLTGHRYYYDFMVEEVN